MHSYPPLSQKVIDGFNRDFDILRKKRKEDPWKYEAPSFRVHRYVWSGLKEAVRDGTISELRWTPVPQLDKQGRVKFLQVGRGILLEAKRETFDGEYFEGEYTSLNRTNHRRVREEYDADLTYRVPRDKLDKFYYLVEKGYSANEIVRFLGEENIIQPERGIFTQISDLILRLGS